MMLYRTHRTPPGISTKAYPIPGYRCEVRTDLVELSSKGVEILQNSQNYRVGYGAVQNSQNLSDTGMTTHTRNIRENNPGIQKVKVMFRRVRVIPG